MTTHDQRVPRAEWLGDVGRAINACKRGWATGTQFDEQRSSRIRR